jgi:hypothetical protein
MLESIAGIAGLFNKNGKEKKAENPPGKDFLGEEAIHTLEKKCSGKGINVIFNIPEEKFPLDENQLKSTKEGVERMVSLRPRSMVVNGEDQHINILTLRSLFIRDEVNPTDNTINRTRYDNNLFGPGFIFSINRSYDKEEFATEQLTPGYAIVTKEFVPNSTNVTWDQQEAVLRPDERRTRPVEDVWDSILKYAATEEKLFGPIEWNATDVSTKDGQIITVGGFDSMGLNISLWNKAKKEGIGIRSQLKSLESATRVNNPPLI